LAKVSRCRLASAKNPTPSVGGPPASRSSAMRFSSPITVTAALNNTGNGGAFTEYTLTYPAQAADAGNYVAVSFKTAGSAGGSWAIFA